MDDNNSERNIILIVIAAAVICGVVFVCVALLGAFLFFGFSISAPRSGPGGQQVVTVIPLDTPTPTATDTPAPSPTTEAPVTPTAENEDTVEDPPISDAAFDALLEDIEDNVAEVRELDELEEVDWTHQPPADLSEEVGETFLEDYSEEDANDDALVLAALNIVPPGFDLYGFYSELYSTGVAGYYDPETGEMVVVSDDTGNGLNSSDEFTYAHEFIHALQDLHFDLNEFLHYDDPEWNIANADASTARRAVIEGDATLGGLLYLSEHMTPERGQEALLGDTEAVPEVYSTAPDFIISQFFFPYFNGSQFVQRVFDTGGYAAVDALYDDPPTSTEQILHPERYLDARDDPISVEIGDLLPVLGNDWRLVIEYPFGEFLTMLFLAEQVPVGAAEDAAAGWGGDLLAAYANDADETSVLVMRYVWDDATEATEFYDIARDFGGTWSDGQIVFDTGPMICWDVGDVFCAMRVGQTETLIVRAPDEDVARDLLGHTYP